MDRTTRAAKNLPLGMGPPSRSGAGDVIVIPGGALPMPRRCSLPVFHGSGSPDVGRDRIMLRGRPWCRVGRRKFTTGLREAAEGQPVIKDRSVEQRQLARRVEQMQFGQSQPELDLVAGRKR